MLNIMPYSFKVFVDMFQFPLLPLNVLVLLVYCVPVTFLIQLPFLSYTKVTCAYSKWVTVWQ